MVSWNVVVLLIFTNSVFSANRSDMDFVELQGGLFAHYQEWNFQGAKRSDKSSSTMQEGVLLMLRNSFYRLGNFVIFNMFGYGL